MPVTSTAQPRPPIHFYLDFVSTYSYFATERIDAMAQRHGCAVHWHIVSLPHIFKGAGTTPPMAQTLKFAHNRQDVDRLTAMQGVPLVRLASPPDVQWARLLFHALARDDARLAARFAWQAMRLRFGQGVELNTAEAVAQAAAGLGLAPARIAAAREDASAKQALIAATDAALAAGMFGAPYATCGAQRFWGHDRVVDHLDWWLARSPDPQSATAAPGLATSTPSVPPHSKDSP